MRDVRTFSRGSRRFATVVPARISSYQLVSARISSYQLVDTVYPYGWRVRTFGWYRTSTLIRIRKFLIPDSSTPRSGRVGLDRPRRSRGGHRDKGGRDSLEGHDRRDTEDGCAWYTKTHTHEMIDRDRNLRLRTVCPISYTPMYFLRARVEPGEVVGRSRSSVGPASSSSSSRTRRRGRHFRARVSRHGVHSGTRRRARSRRRRRGFFNSSSPALVARARRVARAREERHRQSRRARGPSVTDVHRRRGRVTEWRARARGWCGGTLTR